MENKAQLLLECGLDEMGITLDTRQIGQLMRYLYVLYKWNKTYNLTAVRDVMEMVRKHILDSLSVLPPLKNEAIKTLADVGTGAGLPGVPLAIANPCWRISLIDSNSKKTGFLKHAEMICNLENIQVVTSRVETMEQPVDAIISRAFSSLDDMVRLTRGMQTENTVLWAMKGKFPEQELSGLPKPYRVSASYLLRVPGIKGERHLLKISRGTSL